MGLSLNKMILVIPTSSPFKKGGLKAIRLILGRQLTPSFLKRGTGRLLKIIWTDF